MHFMYNKVSAAQIESDLTLSKNNFFKILLIEDDKSVREILLKFLTGLDFEVMWAANGTSGLELFRTHQPDILITDLRLPDLQGLEILRMINKEEYSQVIKIISTGYGEKEDVIEALNLGVSDFLEKPINYELLKLRLKKSIDKIILQREYEHFKLNSELEKKQITAQYEDQLDDEKKIRKVAQLFEMRARQHVVLAKGLNLGTILFENNKIIEAGDACFEILNYDLKELSKINFLDLFEYSYREQIENIVANFEEVPHMDIVLLTKNNKRIYVDMHIHFFKNELNEVVNWGIAFYDVSNRVEHPLTGLPGEKIFRDRLNQSIIQTREKTSRNKQTNNLAIVYVDINNLKPINDTFGHQNGDRLIKLFAGILKKNIRPTDTVAHLHGDEFVILLNDIEDGATVQKRIKQIIQIINTSQLILDSGESLPISASFGGVVYDFNWGADTDENLITLLLDIADKEMYSAKDSLRSPDIYTKQPSRLKIYNQQGIIT